jgi:hypothetical protein
MEFSHVKIDKVDYYKYITIQKQKNTCNSHPGCVTSRKYNLTQSS